MERSSSGKLARRRKRIYLQCSGLQWQRNEMYGTECAHSGGNFKNGGRVAGNDMPLVFKYRADCTHRLRQLI